MNITLLRRLGYAVTLSFVSALCSAQEFTPPSETLTLDTMVIFEGASAPLGGQVAVANDKGRQLKQVFNNQSEMAIDINNFAGEVLADGLYKYQITPNSPLSQLTDAERASIPDNQRGLIDTAEHFGLESTSAATVIGSFRIQNGQLVDPGLVEE